MYRLALKILTSRKLMIANVKILNTKTDTFKL
jgi:hypothetical protein